MPRPFIIVAAHEVNIDTEPGRLKRYETFSQKDAGRQLLEHLNRIKEPRFVCAHTIKVKAKNEHGHEYWDIRTVVLVSETKDDAKHSELNSDNYDEQ